MEAGRVQMRALDRWALKVLWAMVPLYALMAGAIAAGVLTMAWEQWLDLFAVGMAAILVPTLAHWRGLWGRPMRYLTVVAMLVNVEFVSIHLPDTSGTQWPLWLVPVTLSLVYADVLLTVLTSTAALGLAGGATWLHYAGAAISQQNTASTEEMAAGSSQVSAAVRQVEQVTAAGAGNLQRVRADLNQLLGIVYGTALAANQLTELATGLHSELGPGA